MVGLLVVFMVVFMVALKRGGSKQEVRYVQDGDQ